MEKHFPEFPEKRTTLQGIPRFSEISYWEFTFHFTFFPEFPDFLESFLGNVPTICPHYRIFGISLNLKHPLLLPQREDDSSVSRSLPGILSGLSQQFSHCPFIDLCGERRLESLVSLLRTQLTRLLAGIAFQTSKTSPVMTIKEHYNTSI